MLNKKSQRFLLPDWILWQIQYVKTFKKHNAWLYIVWKRNDSRNNKGQNESRAKKGLWNGGCLPLGYVCDSENKKLIINPKEAKIGKFIF